MKKSRLTRLVIRAALLSGLLPLLLTGVGFAQAETSQKGRGLASIYFSRNATDERFDFNGDRTRLTPAGSRNGTLTTSLLTFQAAYGITSRLELEILVPVVLNSEVRTVGVSAQNLIEPRRAEASGIANARVNVRYNLVREPLFLTARFGFKSRANSTDLQRTQSPVLSPIDEGTNDYEFAGQISRRFGKFGIGGEAGVRIRGDQTDAVVDADPASRRRVTVSPANEFIYNFRASYAVNRRFSLSLLADGVAQGDYDAPFRTVFVGDGFTPRTAGAIGAPTGVTPDFRRQTGRQLFKLGPFASVSVTPRTVITGGVQFAAAGRNAPTGAFFTVGVSRFF